MTLEEDIRAAYGDSVAAPQPLVPNRQQTPTPEEDLRAPFGAVPQTKAGTAGTLEEDIRAAYGDSSTLHAALQEASTANPEEIAKKRQLAQKLSIPTALMPTSLAEAEAEVFNKKHVASDILTNSPKTAKVLEKDANIHKNDIGNLQGIERALPASSTIARGIWTDLTESFTQAGIGGRIALADSVNSRLNIDQGKLPPDEALLAAFRASQKRQEAATPDFDNYLGELVYSGASSLAQMVPAVAVGVATRSPALAIAVSTAPVAGQAYGKYRARGGSADEAALGAGVEAAAELLGLRPMTFIVKELGKKGAWDFAKGYAKTAILPELAASYIQTASDFSIANPEATFSAFVASLPDVTAKTIVGVLMGSAAFGGTSALARKISAKDADSTAANAGMETLQKITELATNNSVRKNDPEKFHEAIAHISDNTDLKEVFVSQAVLEGLFADKAGAELLQKMPEVAAQMAEARATQGDVSISMADYATYLAGDFDDVLLPALKVSAKGATFEQSKTYAQSRQGEMQAQADALAATSEPIMTREEFDAAQVETPELPTPVTDRRAHTEDGARVERRVDAPARKKFKDMTPDEQQAAYYTDPGTGAKNLRAYEEADKLPVQISIDADNLGWFNNQMSEEAGNEMLNAVGKAFQQATGEFYRTGGDEFSSQANTPEEAAQIISKAKEILATATVRVTRPDGTVIEKTGLEITYGLGSDKEQANAALYAAKDARKAAARAAGVTVNKDIAGADPTGVSRRAAEGEQSTGNIQEAVTYEQYLANHKNKDALAEADVQIVHEAILAGIKSTGRYSEVVAEFNALSIRAAYVQMAARAGIKPSELYAQKPLTFASSGGRGFNQTAGVPLSEVARHVNANGRQPMPEDVIGEAAGGATEFALRDVPL